MTEIGSSKPIVELSPGNVVRMVDARLNRVLRFLTDTPGRRVVVGEFKTKADVTDAVVGIFSNNYLSVNPGNDPKFIIPKAVDLREYGLDAVIGRNREIPDSELSKLKNGEIWDLKKIDSYLSGLSESEREALRDRYKPTRIVEPLNIPKSDPGETAPAGNQNYIDNDETAPDGTDRLQKDDETTAPAGVGNETPTAPAGVSRDAEETAPTGQTEQAAHVPARAARPIKYPASSRIPRSKDF